MKKSKLALGISCVVIALGMTTAQGEPAKKAAPAVPTMVEKAAKDHGHEHGGKHHGEEHGDKHHGDGHGDKDHGGKHDGHGKK